MDSGDAVSSNWADLQPDVLVKVSADLSLLDSLHCEKVCTVWRQFAFSRVGGPDQKKNTGNFGRPWQVSSPRRRD